MSKSSVANPETTSSSRPTRVAAEPGRPGPSTEQIARRAYEIFLARGGEHGHDQEDWAQAERELRLGRQ